jgi:mRNA interferase YafQ
MRKIERTKRFKSDYKRETNQGGRYRATLDAALKLVLEALANDQPLDRRYLDHALTGDWKDYRDCHIKPDLLLIYRKPDAETLQLVRLGSHSELGL